MKKNPLIQIHVAGVAICLLIIVGAIVFAGQSIQKRRGIFINARQELATVQALQHQSMNDRARMTSQVKESLARSAAFIPLEPVTMMNQRMVRIVELAESEGIQVDALQNQPLLTEGLVQVQPFVLTGFADADAAYMFLRELEQSMNDVHIQSIDLSGVSTENSRVHIQVLMYWFVESDGGEQ